MTAGVPWSRVAASAFTRRSVPTSAGRSTRIGIGTLPAFATTRTRPRRRATASSVEVSGGTTDVAHDRVDVGDRGLVEPEQPLDEQLELIRRHRSVGRAPAGSTG